MSYYVAVHEWEQESRVSITLPSVDTTPCRSCRRSTTTRQQEKVKPTVNWYVNVRSLHRHQAPSYSSTVRNVEQRQGTIRHPCATFACDKKLFSPLVTSLYRHSCWLDKRATTSIGTYFQLGLLRLWHDDILVEDAPFLVLVADDVELSLPVLSLQYHRLEQRMRRGEAVDDLIGSMTCSTQQIW